VCEQCVCGVCACVCVCESFLLSMLATVCNMFVSIHLTRKQQLVRLFGSPPHPNPGPQVEKAHFTHAGAAQTHKSDPTASHNVAYTTGTRASVVVHHDLPCARGMGEEQQKIAVPKLVETVFFNKPTRFSSR
jgi:hypothetical protein